MSIGSTAAEQEFKEHRQIIRAVFEAQRETLQRLHDSDSIGDAVLRRMERDLDLEERQMMTSAYVNTRCGPT